MPEGWKPGDPIPMMDMSMFGPPASQPEGPGLEAKAAILKQQPSDSETSEDEPQASPAGMAFDASFRLQGIRCSAERLLSVCRSLEFVCNEASMRLQSASH